jgi:3-deoxy-7-phosphoheptulonate synthase
MQDLSVSRRLFERTLNDMIGMIPAASDSAPSPPYKLACSAARGGEPTVVEAGGRRIGGEHFALMAGPCTVETLDQTVEIAHAVRAAGATMLRGGAYKPRTSPYAFQGLGAAGLQMLAEAKAQTGLPVVTELLDARDVEAVLEVADVIQIGARNMQNYALLSEVGRTDRPVMIKRGLASTIEELLMAAEYVLKEGNASVVLCERGIRTFETAYRFTLDLAAVAVLKTLTHLPVVVDPSHAAGRRDLVEPLAMAAAAVGADGIVVEVHPDPDAALCDGPQTLRLDDFARFAGRIEQAAALSGKHLGVAVG